MTPKNKHHLLFQFLLLIAYFNRNDAFTTPPGLQLTSFAGRTTSKTMQKMAFVDTSSIPSFLLSLEEAATQTLSDPSAVQPAVDAAADSSGGGWIGFLAGPIEFLLQAIHSLLVTVGMDVNAWGVSIIVMTLVIKLVTYPLTKSQLESTNKMQALQPTIKGIQAKYASNPEVMNQKVAEVYQTEEVNPLAGCLPAIIQIPVFIGLYRAVLTLAKDDKLNEPFLWLPNLEGPVYGADPTQGSDWILKGWENGTPSLGWEDTLLFLTIPVILVISQAISQNLMQPKTDDPQQQQANVVLKFLPFLIGWFSLNVPAALGIYWVVNNIFTTALTLQIRSGFETETASAGAGSGTAAMKEPEITSFMPSSTLSKEKPSGFGTAADTPTVKEITAPIDAEVVAKDMDASEEKGEESDASSETPKAPKKKRGGKKKRKGKK